MDSQIFDSYVVGRGGQLDITQFGSDSLFHYHKERTDNAIQNLAALQPQQPPLNIHFDYVKNANLNAFAFAVGQRHFVGLHGGSIPIVHSLFLQLLAHPQLLQHVGDPTQEVAPTQYRQPGLIDANNLYLHGGTDGRPLSEVTPRDFTRKLYARILATLAIDFLVHHELAHVLYGHLGFLNRRTGAAFIAELDWVRPAGLSALDLQTLEMDADCFAVTQGVFAVLDLVKRQESLNSEWRKHFATVEDGMHLWLLAVFFVLRLFTTASLDIGQLHTRSHPPARLRQFIAMSTAIEAIQKFGSPELARQIRESQAGVIREAEDAYAVITGENPEYDTIRDAISPESLTHLDLLLATWKQLRPQLLPFARLPLVD